MTTLKRHAAVALFAVMFLAAASDAFASHFRFATISTRVPNPAQPTQVVITVEMALRITFYGNPPIGSQVAAGSVYVLGPNNQIVTTLAFTPTVQSTDPPQDWLYGRQEFAYTIPVNQPGAWRVMYQECCRVSTLADGNNDQNFYLTHTFIATAQGVVNNSPVSSMTPVRFLAANRPNFFQLPAADPDGHALTYRLATTAESGLPSPSPVGHGPFNLSSSGLVTWTPNGLGLFAMQVIVTDAVGASVPMDFVMQVLTPLGTPPTLRVNNQTTPVSITTAIGVPVSVPITATDTDSMSLSLGAVGVPAGATTTPSLPFLVGTVPLTASTVFNWTPGLGDLGTRVIEFYADDSSSNSATNSLTINVVNAELMYVTGLLRDFGPADAGFNKPDGDNALRLVQTVLDSDRKPVFDQAAAGLSTTIPGGAGFSQFYRKTPAEVVSFTATNLFNVDSNVFSFNATDFRSGDKYFTYELHTYYTYTPGQSLTFKSSDDLWVFIDGKLALDLGGVHTTARQGVVNGNNIAVQLGLAPGNTYNMDIFYAHRGNSHVPSMGMDLPEAAICSAVGALVPTTLPTIAGTAQTVGAVTRLSTAGASAPSSGAAWTSAQRYVLQGFTAEFDFKIAPQVAGGGEGLAFVLQSVGPGARGGDGPNLGYAGLTNSLAIEFDTHSDLSLSDPSYDHISVHTGLDGMNSASETFARGRSLNDFNPNVGTPLDLNINVTRKARVVYEPGFQNPTNPPGVPAYGWLKVYLDNFPAPVVQAQISNQEMLQAFPSGSAYFGFTTGAVSTPQNTTATVEVTNFKFAKLELSGALSNLTQPPSAQMPDTTGFVILQLRDTCNAKVRFGGDAAAITASMQVGSYVTPVTITDLSDGTYRLSYTPRVGGPWALNVSFNGQQIVQNPFIVNVAPATPTVTASGGTFPYNGSARVATGTVKGVFNETLSPALSFTYNAAAQAVDANTYDVIASFVGNQNYAPASATTTVTITKVAPTVTVDNHTVIYTGLAQSATGVVKGVMGETLGTPDFSYTPGTPINVGNYGVQGSYAGNINYHPATGAGTLTINRATPTVVVTNVGTLYDGNPHPATAIANGVNGESFTSGITITYNGSPSAPVSAGTHAVSATFAPSGNYTTATGTGSVVIGKATPTVTVNSASVTYNAAPHGVTAQATGVDGAVLGQANTIKYAGSTTQPTNAGDYPVVATFNETANYTAADGNGLLTINAATPTVAVDPLSFVYDGGPHSSSGVITGIGGIVIPGALSFTYDGDGTAPTNAKSYAVAASFAGAGNYGPATGNGTLAITPATPTVRVYSFSFEYDGTPRSLTGAVTGIDDEPLGSPTFTYEGSASGPTNVGVYDVEASFAGAGNYGPASGNGVLIITRARPTVQVSGGPFTYNGQPHAATAMVVGVNGADLGAATTVTYNGDGGAPTNAGSYAVIASVGETANYEEASGNGTIVIDKAESTVEVQPATVTYDGAGHGTTAVVKGVNNVAIGSADSFTYNGSNSQPVNAASYAVVAAFNGNGNYNPATGNGTLTISPATPTVNVDDSTVNYDGASHAATGTATGIGGAVLGPLTFTYDGASAVPVNAKQYQVVGSFAAGGNYGPASDTGLLTILRIAPTVQVVGGSFTYDGLSHPATATVTGLNGANLGSASITYNGAATVPVNAGSYAVAASFAASGNYSAASATGTIAIARAALTITADNKTMNQGSPVPALTASYAGFVNGQTAAVLDTPVTLTTTATSSSAVGSYPIVAGAAADANYTIAFVAGSMSVTPSDITPGLMTGHGWVRDDDDRFDFEFVVRERANGSDRGRLEVNIKDEDRDRKGNKKKNWKKRDDRFESRTITNVVFSDDPTIRPGRSRRPQIDTVRFAGTGEWNGRGGYRFEAFAQDMGEPGRRHSESITITIFDAQGRIVAQVEGELDGGNIQSARIRH